MRIEFLTKPNCEPSTVMLGRMLTLYFPEEFAVVDVTALAWDDVRRGYDTPTLLVDGLDVFGSVPRTDLSVPPNSRLYPGGVPSLDAIRAAIARLS